MVSKKFYFGIEFVKFLSALILSKLYIVLSIRLVHTSEELDCSYYGSYFCEKFNPYFKFRDIKEKGYFYYPTFSVKRLYQILYGIGKPEMKYEKTESANAIYLTY